MKTIHLEIFGRVQGVYYRSSAKEIAQYHHLSGWIRNDFTGKVEALVTGNPEDLEQFIHWCNTGPKRAVVERVIVNEVAFQTFESFEVVR